MTDLWSIEYYTHTHTHTHTHTRAHTHQRLNWVRD
jgi:hypothetical protein